MDRLRSIGINPTKVGKMKDFKLFRINEMEVEFSIGKRVFSFSKPFTFIFLILEFHFIEHTSAYEPFKPFY